MITLTSSETLTLAEGLNIIYAQVTDSLDLVVDFPSNTQGSLFLKVNGNGTLNLTINALENSNYKYLWINHSDKSLEVNEVIRLLEGATLEVNYGEMSLGSHNKDTLIHYEGIKSSVMFRAAIVTFNQLKWNILARHTAKKSYASVNCNAIVLDNAKLHLEIAGKIEKGFGGSETHQMSRIMNLGENAKGIVYPKLLIDENDVAASHAASVGQPNEEHIYYLQSRGMTRLEALKLIITGYLMPIVQGIDDKTIQEELREEIMKKVNEQWG